MKKTLIIGIILLITFFSAKSILAVKSSEALPAFKAVNTPLITREVALQKESPILPDSKLLDVPLLNQMDKPLLYNGCEVTSLAMILNYSGVNVTKNELAKNIKTVPLTYRNGKKGNPNAGFVGDMAHGPGLGVYNGPVYELAQKYAGDKAVNLTGSPFTDLLKKVSQGHPVWIITTTNFAPVSVFQTWDTPQGKIDITFSEHSVVITGYDENYIYINDPYGTKNKKLDRDNFIKAWEKMEKQAIIIEN
ncbi:C39 family peptidase [Paenibacillus sp. BSR1-1]|uniref:C39 family peptidase n=1 Tax=Paenibacillus sp. BSR1-1 TaxID=3020845 RepID=UPI0025AF1EA9|nr:C39 family peptidase [Paenibacillus sp. BSR1-1]MDN3017558.1 C39 family peptidase [Paenibacillus sp. BSR1-1]